MEQQPRKAQYALLENMGYIMGSNMLAHLARKKHGNIQLKEKATTPDSKESSGRDLYMEMIPHKTKRGAAALARLKAYEGVPPPYDKTKRMVIPDALKVLRLQPGHKYCLLGRLSEEVGWGYYDTIKELEEKRKEKAKVSYERRKQLTRLRVKAESAADEKLGSQLDILAPIKY
ncbi:hypothetical protein LUZ60_010434 [Juncus effusus]|nr:hypothetical protein LUZ60_010434 [Juncus effusus]